MRRAPSQPRRDDRRAPAPAARRPASGVSRCAITSCTTACTARLTWSYRGLLGRGSAASTLCRSVGRYGYAPHQLGIAYSVGPHRRQRALGQHLPLDRLAGQIGDQIGGGLLVPRVAADGEIGAAEHAGAGTVRTRAAAPTELPATFEPGPRGHRVHVRPVPQEEQPALLERLPGLLLLVRQGLAGIQPSRTPLARNSSPCRAAAESTVDPRAVVARGSSRPPTARPRRR